MPTVALAAALLATNAPVPPARQPAALQFLAAVTRLLQADAQIPPAADAAPPVVLSVALSGAPSIQPASPAPAKAAPKIETAPVARAAPEPEVAPSSSPAPAPHAEAGGVIPEVPAIPVQAPAAVIDKPGMTTEPAPDIAAKANAPAVPAAADAPATASTPSSTAPPQRSNKAKPAPTLAHSPTPLADTGPPPAVNDLPPALPIAAQIQHPPDPPSHVTDTASGEVPAPPRIAIPVPQATPAPATPQTPSMPSMPSMPSRPATEAAAPVAPRETALTAGPASPIATGLPPGTALPTPVIAVPHPAQAMSAPAQIGLALVAIARSPDGRQQLNLQLQPPDLGRVDIQIDRPAEGAAKVSLIVAQPTTLLLLLRDQPALHKALDNAGVAAEGRTVSFHLAPTAGPSPGRATADAGTDPFSSGQPPPGGQSFQANGNHQGGRQAREQTQPRSALPDDLPLRATPVTAPAPARRSAVDITA